MTAPTAESATSPQVAPTTSVVDLPEGAAPIRLPVMVVEGMETADGRFIEPGALQVRTLPIGLYSQVKSSHGSLQGDAATVLVGAITSATRRPGPEVQQLSTGEAFPEGTFVWEGTGWMYKDVPAPPDKSAYQLVADKALRGNSVDLSDVDAEFEYADGQDMANDPHPQRIVITSGFIGATTLVGQPAFPDAFIELDGMAPDAVSDEVLTAAVPAWRSSETGDVCSPCTAIPGPYDALLAHAVENGMNLDPAFELDVATGLDIEPDDMPRHTGGMLALIPANPNMLRVPGGDPAEELHLTLAYLGDNVLNWPAEDIEAVHRIAREATDFQAMHARIEAEAEFRDDTAPVESADMRGRTAAQKGPITGVVFSFAVFNPNGDNGRDPATVYLLDGSGDRAEIEGLHEEVCYRVRDALGTAQFPEQHHPYVPHITVAYGNDYRNGSTTRNNGARTASGGSADHGHSHPNEHRMSDLAPNTGAGQGDCGNTGTATNTSAPGGSGLRAEQANPADGGRTPSVRPASLHGADAPSGDASGGALQAARRTGAVDALPSARHPMGHTEPPGSRGVSSVRTGTDSRASGTGATQAVDAGAEGSQERTGALAIQESGGASQGSIQAAATQGAPEGSAKWFLNLMTYTGPVEFSHLRVALGDSVTDYPLGGGAIIASGTGTGPLPSAEWFTDPKLDGPTPLTVGTMTHAGAPVYGHLACWGTCHIGFAGKCITPPRSASAYAYFMVHATQALAADGELVDIPVGYGTVGTGHADVRRDALAAAEHYDNTGTVAFEYAVGEDAHGIWFAGRLLPNLGQEMEAKARGTVFSGDWRQIRGKLELVASLGVNVPGFPVPRVRVASGQPVALVAAGAVPVVVDNDTVVAAGLGVSREELAEIVAHVRRQVVADHLAAVRDLTEGAVEVALWNDWCTLADHTVIMNADHPWFSETLDEPDDGTDGFAQKNWVAKAGGLPKYIKRISKHLRAKGMTESQAIATAVNAAKRMCSTGDLNFPGSQQVNPGSRAEACEAVAEWNAKKAKS